MRIDLTVLPCPQVPGLIDLGSIVQVSIRYLFCGEKANHRMGYIGTDVEQLALNPISFKILSKLSDRGLCTSLSEVSFVPDKLMHPNASALSNCSMHSGCQREHTRRYTHGRR